MSQSDAFSDSSVLRIPECSIYGVAGTYSFVQSPSLGKLSVVESSVTSAKSVIRMRRPLEAPLPVPAWPPGVGLVDFTPAEAAEVYALLAEAYAHSGDTMEKFSPWWRALSADPE